MLIVASGKIKMIRAKSGAIAIGEDGMVLTIAGMHTANATIIAAHRRQKNCIVLSTGKVAV